MTCSTSQRGFTLLIAVILASVALGIGMALLDVAYKQVILASAAKQSQSAFYNADAAMECALYYDQKLNAFSYSTPLGAGSILCNNIAIADYTTNQSAGTRTTTFSVRCSSSNAALKSAGVTVYKTSAAATSIYVEGYNTCDTTNTRRIERGLKATY